MVLEGYILTRAMQTMVFRPANAASPIILSIPHDGLLQNDGEFRFLKLRSNGIKSHDPHVWSFVKQILLSKLVHVVRGLVPRCYIDYNRSPEQALEESLLLPWYDYYHDSIGGIVEGLLSKYLPENILLIDIHNMRSLQPVYGNYDVILGTCNKKTVVSDVDVCLAKVLRDDDFEVFLPETRPVRNKPDLFRGGFTVRHYAEAYKINAIQIEIAGELLATPLSNKGLALAHSIIGFLQLYKAIVRGDSVS